MEAQLAEAMALMQEHPELNTPENRQILHKLRYSIQGGGENDIQVKVQAGDGYFDGVLSVNKDGELELAIPKENFDATLHTFVDNEQTEQAIPKDNAFLLPHDFALLVLERQRFEGRSNPYLIAFGPDDIKKLGGMPTDAYLQAQKDGGQIAEFKKIAASDEDLDYNGAVGSHLRTAGDYEYRTREAGIYRQWVPRVFGKPLPQAFSL